MPSEPVVIVASSEFTLKSPPVRRTLEQRLIDDLKTALRRAGLEGAKLEKDAGRIIIHGLQDASSPAQYCARVFGVAYAAPASMLHVSMDEIVQETVTQATTLLKTDQSFSIRAHRAMPSPVSRREIEVRGGAEVLEQLKNRNIRVDLKHPDVTLFVDLTGERAYVYSEKIPGPGGLPLSSQWKMLAVLDSGPLSILAAYSLMRRGCMVQLLIPLSKELAAFDRGYQFSLAQKLRMLVTRTAYKAYALDLDLIRGAVGPLEKDGARRFVRAAAAKLAKEKHFKGVILSDVSGNLDRLHEDYASDSCPPVILYPLIGSEWEDLVLLAEEIGISRDDLLHPLRNWDNPKAPDEAPHLPDNILEVINPILLDDTTQSAS